MLRSAVNPPPPPTPPPGPSAQLGAVPTLAKLRTQIKRLEVLALLLAGIVSLPLGYAFLYKDNATWGTFADVLAAFVWGLGAQSFAGKAFSGIFDVQKGLLGDP
ncbi:unnamed protein product [Phaeothamnion confervicola]